MTTQHLGNLQEKITFLHYQDKRKKRISTHDGLIKRLK